MDPGALIFKDNNSLKLENKKVTIAVDVIDLSNWTPYHTFIPQSQTSARFPGTLFPFSTTH